MLVGGGLMLLWRFGALMVSGARAVGTLGIREVQAMTATVLIQTHIPKGRPQTESVLNICHAYIVTAKWRISR